MRKTQLNHIDLFSGIGGFSLGLTRAGLPIKQTYFSEKDKYAISVYKRNFPDAEYLGSVESISGSGLPSGEYVVTFGFPCQDLSVAGKRKGFDGSRSSLFFEAMRIIDELRPRFFIFENVKGLFSSNDGKDFTIALRTIADLGVYECQWQLLNTAWFLPQNRERVYLVGSHRTCSRPEIFPIRENYTGLIEGDRKTTVVNCLSAGGKSGGLHSNMTLIQKVGQYRTFNDNRGLRWMKNNISPSLCARVRSDGSGQPIILSNSALGRKFETRTDLPPLRSHSGNSHDCYVMLRDQVRRLTPIEWERLQGFPDNWTQYGHEDQLISDTQRYKMCGNAVSAPVVETIGTRIKETQMELFA